MEEIGEKGLSINARMKDGRCLELEIPFEAFYQAENAMLAVRTLDVLRYPGECPRTGCRMPGHGPCICPDGKEWLLEPSGRITLEVVFNELTAAAMRATEKASEASILPHELRPSTPPAFIPSITAAGRYCR